MKLVLLFLSVISLTAAAQLPISEEQFLNRLKPGGALPADLLQTKTVVFYPYTMNPAELEKIQQSFQRTGIDAVVYYETDYVSAGRDALVTFANTLNKREVSNIFYITKQSGVYTFYIAPYNRKANLVEEGPAWSDTHRALDYLLQQLYRTAANTLKNQNLLINDFPEIGPSVYSIEGNRNEFFAIDLKVDQLAVPKFGDPEMDARLEELMKQYPHKFTFTDPTLSEAELRKQGFFYVLRFVKARNKISRSILGYDAPRAQNAVVSVKFNDGVPQLKSINLNDQVFKFYFKHIDSGNTFLGTKWDADQDWAQALQNQLTGYKVEFGIQ